MEAVFPASASALARGRRRRRQEPQQRHRTASVTFAEIKEVDEEQELCETEEVCASSERRRRPDELLELSREFAEFRRRRARRTALREPDEAALDFSPSGNESALSRNITTNTDENILTVDTTHSKAHSQLTRASSEPT